MFPCGRRCEFTDFYSEQMLNVKIERFLLGLALVCPIFLLPSFFHNDYAQAAECTTKTCIDVYVQNGQIVIEAHKGSGPTAKVAPKVAPKVKPKVKVAPSPKPTSAYIAPKRTVPRKGVVRKVVHKVAPPVSLSDKLIKLIPTGNISHEPSSDALVNIHVIYWCDLPGIFSTKVAILGEAVNVTMRPSFLWSFGDGTFFATTSPGAAYPNQVVSHTYNKAGTYAVLLVATWGGTWSNNGVLRAITGEIRKVSLATVSVANAPTRLTR